MAKLKENCEEQSTIELHKMEKEMNLLLEEKNKWEDENKQFKEENKRLKYTLFDLLKCSEGNNDNMKRIR
jgi:hypothetical protein